MPSRCSMPHGTRRPRAHGRRAVLGTSLVAALALLAAPAPAAGQSRGTAAIRGSVTSSDGSPLSGAVATLVQESTGDRRTALSNARGEFLFLLLPPGGPYTLTVESLGYEEGRVEDLELRVGQVEQVSLTLQTQAIAVEGINVQVGRSAVFNPGRVGPTTLVTPQEIERIPLLSRNLMELAALSPLVKTTEGGGFSVLGQNDRYNAVLVDGLWNKDVFGLTAGGLPAGQAGAKLLPLDAVQQYEVLVAPFDVRLSGFTGGALNAVTRSGTNQLWVRGFGAFRQKSLTGDLELPVGTADASGVSRTVLGLSVGGPIVRDRIHFFVSGEWERRTRPPLGYNLGRDDTFLIRLAPSAVEDAIGALANTAGTNPGDFGAYPLRQRLSNLFARLDWRLSATHRLTVRNNLAAASHDDDPNRLGFNPYGLSSNTALRKGFANTFSAQLLSTFGSSSNDLTLEVQRSRDETTPVSDAPQLVVDVQSSEGGTSFIRPVRAGAPLLTQDNDLAQTQARLTNTLSTVRSQHTLSVGVTGAFYHIRQRYLPGALGEYKFADVDAVRDNEPNFVQWTELVPGQDPSIGFSVFEGGAFVQDEISAGRGMTMRIGVRLDVPWVLDEPPRDTGVESFFGYRTDKLPSGNVMISPRFGFNWQSGGERRTQVRGGLGLFTGQIPFVWLADAFHNSGLRSVTKVCRGVGRAPELVPGQLPTTCALGLAPTEQRNVTVFDPDFRYPQDMRFSLGLDQEITDDLSASIGILYNRALNQVVLEELNVAPTTDMGPVDGFGGIGRGYYAPHSELGLWDYARPDPNHGQVLLATNARDDEAFAFTLEMKGRLGERGTLQAGYTYALARDRMSLVSTDMISNYGLTPSRTLANFLPLARSDFDRPHKLVLSIGGTPFRSLDDTQVSLLYTGQSGLPFSYVYGGLGDLNGDGYASYGATFERFNDLVYVPRQISELPNLGVATQSLLSQALGTGCLKKWAGKILERNGCRAPWQNRLDLRVAQGFDLGRAHVRLDADIVNVLNLLNSSWGRIYTVRTVTPLLDLLGRAESMDPARAWILTRWSGASYRDGQGSLHPTDPWYASTPDSQWQIQLGARVTVGDGG